MLSWQYCPGNTCFCSCGTPAEREKIRRALYQEFEVQGSFVFGADKQQDFIPPQPLLNGNWSVTGFCDIKIRLRLACPAALIKDLPVSRNIVQLYAYDPDRGVMADISSKIDDEMSKIESIDRSRPLYGSLSLENGWGRWDFGPHPNGQYYLVSSLIGRYPVTKKGELKTVITDLSFYIHYESPEGWTTSSPLLITHKGYPVSWEGTAAK